jgi:alkylated DNA nucleotide flippase Atl1
MSSDHRSGSALIEICKRVNRVDERIVFHRQRIADRAQELNGYATDGIDKSDDRYCKAKQTLEYHRRKRDWLQTRKSELEQGKERVKRNMMMREAEAYRQAAIRRCGTHRRIEYPDRLPLGRMRQIAAGRRDAATPQLQRTAATPGPTHGNHTQQSYAEQDQAVREHIRLMKGHQPDDPFADPRMIHGHTSDQHVLLNRISKRPQLVDHYPYTKGCLEDTSKNSDDLVRVNAKAAMDEYLEAAHATLANNLTTEMQDLHERIAAQEGLSEQAKLLLLMTTFIPCGRYTTYSAIRDWVRSSHGLISNVHIAGALKRRMIHFALDNIPVHRILDHNGGIGKPSCDFGNHMPDLDDDEQRALLRDEGVRFDKNGRLLGGRLEFHEVEEAMKGTMLEKYIRSFPYRFGG